MCVTVGDSVLENTYVGAWEIMHPNYGYRHVLAYQNVPKNLSDVPNCMLLAIPASQKLTPENILDTSQCPDFLSTMIDSALRKMRSLEIPKNYVTEMGIYHIAILNDVSEIALKETLKQIPSHKTPQISSEFMDFFRNTYPNFPLLLCCFNNQEIAKASPIMVHFVPLRPDMLMLNTLDSHGKLPNLDEGVLFTQKILLGSYQKTRQVFRDDDWQAPVFEVDQSVASEHLIPFLPKYARVYKLEEWNDNYQEDDSTSIKNGDVLFDMRDYADRDEFFNPYSIGILK